MMAYSETRFTQPPARCWIDIFLATDRADYSGSVHWSMWARSR